MLGAHTLLLGSIPELIPKTVFQRPPGHRACRHFKIWLLQGSSRDEDPAVGGRCERPSNEVDCKSNGPTTQTDSPSHDDGVAAFSAWLEMKAHHFSTLDLDSRYWTPAPLKEKQR